MNSTYWELKEQLREYGLCPKEWRWKLILPEKREGVLENRTQIDLCLQGKWQTPKNQSWKWTFLEWQL